MTDTPVTPAPSLAIGHTLRDRRMEKSLTPEQCAQDTKIHIKFIRALEDERWTEFPARVYLEGFLKRYAEYLNLDGQSLVTRVRGASQEATKPGFSSPVPKENEDESPSQSSAGRPIWFLAGGAALVLVLALAYVKLEEKRSEMERPPVPETLAPPPAPVQPAPPAAHEIRVTAKSPVWARVWVDGQVKFEGILQPNQTKTWEAMDKLRVMAGNIWLVTVMADGKPVAVKPGSPAGELLWAKPPEPAATLTPETSSAPVASPAAGPAPKTTPDNNPADKPR
jgi:cytoskeleton protein RodZ